VGGRLVAVGGGGCGRDVAVGAGPAEVGVGLGGGETELPAEGILSRVPTLMMVLVSPLASIRAWTVMPNLLAMPLSVSPACAT